MGYLCVFCLFVSVQLECILHFYADFSFPFPSQPYLIAAGYGRHRTTFLKGGEAALWAELELDLTRLYTRNLGRDDRCISDHGREAWFPYLDEEVVAYLHGLSLREIANLGEPLGSGDKMVLRKAAKSVGLTNCTELVKRAVQFGTRIAKHTNIREHGSNRKGSGVTKI